MLWRNGEHYPDPTAGAAFQRIAREEARNEMNEGKRFERDFKASVPPDAWCNRDTRRKQERLVTDYWCYMADGSVVCPKCGNRTDRLNWAVGPAVASLRLIWQGGAAADDLGHREADFFENRNPIR